VHACGIEKEGRRVAPVVSWGSRVPAAGIVTLSKWSGVGGWLVRWAIYACVRASSGCLGRWVDSMELFVDDAARFLDTWASGIGMRLGELVNG